MNLILAMVGLVLIGSPRFSIANVVVQPSRAPEEFIVELKLSSDTVPLKTASASTAPLRSAPLSTASAQAEEVESASAQGENAQSLAQAGGQVAPDLNSIETVNLSDPNLYAINPDATDKTTSGTHCFSPLADGTRSRTAITICPLQSRYQTVRIAESDTKLVVVELEASTEQTASLQKAHDPRSIAVLSVAESELPSKSMFFSQLSQADMELVLSDLKKLIGASLTIDMDLSSFLSALGIAPEFAAEFFGQKDSNVGLSLTQAYIEKTLGVSVPTSRVLTELMGIRTKL